MAIARPLPRRRTEDRTEVRRFFQTFKSVSGDNATSSTIFLFCLETQNNRRDSAKFNKVADIVF